MRNRRKPVRASKVPVANQEVTTVPDKHPVDIAPGTLQVIAGQPFVNTVGLSQYLDVTHDELCNFVLFLVARDVGLAKVDVVEVVTMVAVGGKHGKAVAAVPCYNLSLAVLGMLGEVFVTDPIRHGRICRLDVWFRHGVLDEENRRRALPRTAEEIARDPGLLREVFAAGQRAARPWLPVPLLYEPAVISRNLDTGEITIHPMN